MSAVNAGTLDKVELLRRKLDGTESACHVTGPASDAAIDAAELALGCQFPPSYRAFLRTLGGLALPSRAAVVHEFVGLDVVTRTLAARAERDLGDHLVVVGIGANLDEWFCLDASRPRGDGEYPVRMFDARDNVLDQEFYGDFAQMLDEVVDFTTGAVDELYD